MPAAQPAPVAQDIDEPAARRSIRITLIIISAALLLPILGIVLYQQFGDRPDSGNHSTSAWALVFMVAVVGITLVAVVLLPLSAPLQFRGR